MSDDVHARSLEADEGRKPDPRRTPMEPGCVHHIAFSVSRVTFLQAVKRLDDRKIKHSGVKDRGFMDSIYFTDPLGLLIELASYRFEPPHGFTHADVLFEAIKSRVARGDYNIAEVHLADAIEALMTRKNATLSADRSREPILKNTKENKGRKTMKLHVLKPSVNNMAARVFVRAAKLDSPKMMFTARPARRSSWP